MKPEDLRREIADEHGRTNWDWAMLDKLARERPGQSMPLVICVGTSWGGMRQYGKAFGPYYTAMQEVGQPVIAGHRSQNHATVLQTTGYRTGRPAILGGKSNL